MSNHKISSNLCLVQLNGNYAFSYNEGHVSGGSFREESGSPGNVQGSYGLQDADGRIRTVRYVADANGYRASISSNEPGVADLSPADALVNGSPHNVPATAAESTHRRFARQAGPFKSQQRLASPIAQWSGGAQMAQQAQLATSPLSFNAQIDHSNIGGIGGMGQWGGQGQMMHAAPQKQW